MKLARDYKLEVRRQLKEQHFYNHRLDRYFEPPEPGARDWRNKVHLPPDLEIHIEGPTAAGIGRATDLLVRYLEKFTGWPVPTSVPQVKCIRISHGGSDLLAGRVPNERFTLDVGNDRIAINATTVRGAMAGIVNLIHRLELERSPGLKKGKHSLQPRCGWRFCPDGYGLFDFDLREDPDERILDHILLSGANGVLITLDLALLDDGRILRELGNDANRERREYLVRMADRIGKYGLNLAGNCYPPRLPGDHPLWKKHPEMRGAFGKKRFYTLCCSHPGAIAALGKSWAHLAEDVPQLAAMVWIVGGEGFYHCYMAHPKPAGKTTDCPRCMRKDPEHTVARFVNRVAQWVHRTRDDMEIIAWPYTGWGWTKDVEGSELIDGLNPDRVAFITCPEKDSVFDRGEHDTVAWDYSISCLGPGRRFQTQERRCRKRGIAFYIKTETSVSFEFQNVPFIPAMQRWHERWRLIRKTRPKGIISAWFPLVPGTINVDLGYWAIWASDAEFQTVLERLAESRFGGHGAGLVLQGWRHFSRSMQVYPLLAPRYWAGPAFLGPAHPVSPNPSFLADPVYRTRLPWSVEGYSAGTPLESIPETSCLLSNLDDFFIHILPHDLGVAKDAILLRAMRKAERHWRAGLRCLERVRPRVVGARETTDFIREEAISRWIWMSLVTSVHFIEVIRLRDPLLYWSKPFETSRPSFMRRLKGKIRRILADERKNTLAALDLVRRTPELDLSLWCGAMGAPIATTEKMLIRKLEMIESDLGSLA